MTARPHRFLQYLQELSGRQAWFEYPAENGGAVGDTRRISSVAIEAPGGAVRGIRLGVRLVTKQIVRLLYLAPILLVIKLFLQWHDRELSDLLTFAFVLVVVTFFLLLNLYIVVSVIEHFKSKGKDRVVPPFDEDDDVFGRGLERGGGEILQVRGTIVGIGDALPGTAEVLRDFWALGGAAAWRMVEAVDFAVEPADGGAPVIIQLRTAPMLLASTEKEIVRGALGRFSPGMKTTFDVTPATQGARGGEGGDYLSLSEGDMVELIGRRSGTIPNVQRFELAGRIRTLGNVARAADPYRGAGGEEGLLVVAEPDAPLWIRKV